MDPRVLLIESDGPFARALSIALGVHGYRVDVARDPGEAIRLLTSTDPALVLLDLEMSRGGSDVIKSLSASCRAPIVAMSARDRRLAETRARLAGACEYAQKPMSINELLVSMERALSSSEVTGIVEWP